MPDILDLEIVQGLMTKAFPEGRNRKRLYHVMHNACLAAAMESQNSPGVAAQAQDIFKEVWYALGMEE